MPFLYPPDAVSLMLLWVSLVVLRRSAEDHVKLELRRLEHEANIYWSGTGRPGDAAMFLALLDVMESALGSTGRLSPARLLFVRRCLSRSRPAGMLPDPFSAFEQQIGLPANEGVAETLRRYRRETESSLGVFYLLGSVSGWCLFVWTAGRVARRILRRPERIDRAMEIAERVVTRQGRHALRLASLVESARAVN